MVVNDVSGSAVDTYIDKSNMHSIQRKSITFAPQTKSYPNIRESFPEEQFYEEYQEFLHYRTY